MSSAPPERLAADPEPALGASSRSRRWWALRAVPLLVSLAVAGPLLAGRGAANSAVRRRPSGACDRRGCCRRWAPKSAASRPTSPPAPTAGVERDPGPAGAPHGITLAGSSIQNSLPGGAAWSGFSPSASFAVSAPTPCAWAGRWWRWPSSPTPPGHVVPRGPGRRLRPELRHRRHCRGRGHGRPRGCWSYSQPVAAFLFDASARRCWPRSGSSRFPYVSITEVGRRTTEPPS